MRLPESGIVEGQIQESDDPSASGACRVDDCVSVDIDGRACRNRHRTAPSLIWSPSLSGRKDGTGSSFTNVPFLLPRSSMSDSCAVITIFA